MRDDRDLEQLLGASTTSSVRTSGCARDSTQGWLHVRSARVAPLDRAPVLELRGRSNRRCKWARSGARVGRRARRPAAAVGPSTIEVAALTRRGARRRHRAVSIISPASERLLGVKWAQAHGASRPRSSTRCSERVQYDSNLERAARGRRCSCAPISINPTVVGRPRRCALERQESPLLQVALTDALLRSDRTRRIDAQCARLLGRN